MWAFWYEWSSRRCMHGHACARVQRGMRCTHGMRVQVHDLISGAVLPLHKQLYETVEGSMYGRTANGEKYVPRVCRAVDRATGLPIVGLHLCQEDAELFMAKVKGEPDLGGRAADMY
jgi:hypothetical protein